MTAHKTISGVLLAPCLFLLAQMVSATLALTDNLVISCQSPPAVRQLICDFRVKSPQAVSGFQAKSGDVNLPIGETMIYPWQDAVTAILLLVDTSDPGRQNVIEQNKKQIAALLTAAKPHHRFGLASFDKMMRLEVPVGVNSGQVQAAADRLLAAGKTTELYRSVLTAIDAMRKVQADRKFIFLFSDGQAEDKAYYHDDVVQAANKAGVVITGLGYPRSASLSVALQTLRRLSDETGGLYVEADAGFSLPPAFLGEPYQTTDNGGRFKIDISRLYGTSTAHHAVTLLFKTDIGDVAIKIPLNLPVTPAAEIRTETSTKPAAVIPQPAPPVQVITRIPSGTPSSYNWLWYGIPAVLILLLIITIIIFLLANYKQTRKPSAGGTGFTEFRPYAYLVTQDETMKRYPITRTTWRIGRGKDNEMTLRDSSISRRHAEIHRDKGDRFTIYNLESLNGVYVNNEKISKHVLHEGDMIEIGDICFRFTLLSTEYALEENTEMQNTRAPVAH